MKRWVFDHTLFFLLKEDFVLGKYTAYKQGNRGYVEIVDIEGTVNNLAAFIATRELDSKYTVTDGFDNAVLQTTGDMVLLCPDKEFLNSELLPKLIPYQMGSEPIPEVQYIDQDSLEHYENEAEDELEM